MHSVGAAAAAITILASLQGAGTNGVRIPLKEGLTVVTAIEETRGDYESIKTVATVSQESVLIAYTAEMRGGQRLASSRTVLRADMREAHEYRQEFASGRNQKHPGTTALGPSTAVLEELNSRGETAFTCQTRTGGGIRRISGTLQKVGVVGFPVLLNDRRVEVQAVHARGDFEREKGEFWFLNDPENPLTLRYRFEEKKLPQVEKLEKMLGKSLPVRVYSLEVVKISFPSDESEAGQQGLEQELAEEGRAEVYGIYFDFDSATIRSESAPVLEEIAALLGRNASWQLDIEGHTDSIGTAAHNLDLSRRRAEAVKQALVTDHGIDAARLTTAGYGASRPKESNDTVAGRARNRRVELVKK